MNEWSKKLRKEGYQLDRQIRSIQREEEKVKRTLKEAAKKGDMDACKVLAKEVLHARKAINKIYTSKAHLNSVLLQMKNQLGECVGCKFVKKYFLDVFLKTSQRLLWFIQVVPEILHQKFSKKSCNWDYKITFTLSTFSI